LLCPARSQPGKGGQTPASKPIVAKCQFVATSGEQPFRPKNQLFEFNFWALQ
jgi:hypothetical protein